MKKITLALALILMPLSTIMAQTEKKNCCNTQSGCFHRTLFNHWGLGVGAGTEGINVSVATCVTNFVELELGMNIMPGIKIHGDIDATYNNPIPNSNFGNEIEDNIRVEGDLGRTTVDFKAHIYPFGGNSKFFIAAGFSMGGATVGKLSGHSDMVESIYKEHPELVSAGFNPGIDIDDYRLNIDKNGNVDGGIKVSSFRPYLGLGFGRLVPKNRIGTRLELGVQFHDKPKVYSGNNDNLLEAFSGEKGSDDISDIVDKLTIYPVLKFSIRGRIF